MRQLVDVATEARNRLDSGVDPGDWRNLGSVAEWPIASVLKAEVAGDSHRGFKSYRCRVMDQLNEEYGMTCPGPQGPWVPSSPPKSDEDNE